MHESPDSLPGKSVQAKTWGMSRSPRLNFYILPYLLRVHGVDYGSEHIIAEKMRENDWELDDLELDEMDTDSDDE